MIILLFIFIWLLFGFIGIALMAHENYKENNRVEIYLWECFLIFLGIVPFFCQLGYLIKLIPSHKFLKFNFNKVIYKKVRKVPAAPH